MTELKISAPQAEALREVMSVGTAHAMDAVGKMLSQKVKIELPDVSVIPLSEVPARVSIKSSMDEAAVGLYFQMLGDLSGSILIVFSIESARRLVCTLLEYLPTDEVLAKPSSGIEEQSPETSAIDGEEDAIPMERSALMEVGNILTNSYLNAIAGMMDCTLFPSIPHYAEDMLGAVMDVLLIEISQTSDHALFMQTEFSIENTSISGHILIFPDKESLTKILSRIGME